MHRSARVKGAAAATLAVAAALTALALTSAASGTRTVAPVPYVVSDVQTGRDLLGSKVQPGPDPIQDYVQPDTQIEPSIAVNPANPKNVVTVYQEGRIANGGDATNGYATSFDAGRTWTFGELPSLTKYPGQNGRWERASDAVVAFGPNNVVYANSLVFDATANNGLPSGITVNVSKDGGRTWSQPVTFQDENLGGLNDKNWIVVDTGKGTGHHYGRVYVVWDRIAPVVYNYCDHDCNLEENWLPNLQTIPGLVFPGQGIGAYPVVMNDGGLGIVMSSISGGVPLPNTGDEIDATAGELVFIRAPLAGTTPWPAPLTFLPPVDIASNQSNGVPAQRAGSLPAAAIDPSTGTIYAVWEDGRFRSDGVNDAVMSKSSNGGVSWTPVQKINQDLNGDHVDHYNPTVAVGDGGVVHVAYRQRDESKPGPLYTPVIDTIYQESFDGGLTFAKPLKVNSKPSNPYYGAFSRAGTFEGDYNQIASAGGYTYVVRDQGAPATKSEPPALVPNPDGSNTLVLTPTGKGHQHQVNWVAVVRNRAR